MNQNNNSVFVSVSTMYPSSPSKLIPKKDKDGYYCNVPVAVLGIPSRNKTIYTQESVMAQFDSNAYFGRMVLEGYGSGEQDHPQVVDFSTPQNLKRFLTIAKWNEAMAIRKAEIKHVPELNAAVIFLDTKPCGPKGKYYEEIMNDPTRNCGYSLRSISKPIRKDPSTGIVTKQMIRLVTFDCDVSGAPGFQYTCKWNIPSVSLSKESIDEDEYNFLKNFEIDDDSDCMIDERMTTSSYSAIESIDTELNDIFKTRKLILHQCEVGYIDRSNMLIHQPDGTSASLMNKIMRM